MKRIDCFRGLTFAVLAIFAVFANAETDEVAQARQALASFQEKDAGIAEFVNKSAGYVVFPMIEKGAVVVGGAHGKGVLFEGETAVGAATVSQGTVGLQIGAQVYSQVMFLETQDNLNAFKENKWAWQGEATAVAAKSGVAKNTDFKNGVAIFISDQKGAMASLAAGGQKFTFTPY
jgi:lipid-binding SYLF domain-containing protein